MTKSIKRRRLVARRGAVIVEFALVVPFMFIIVFGVIDFSRITRAPSRLGSACHSPTGAEASATANSEP